MVEVFGCFKGTEVPFPKNDTITTKNEPVVKETPIEPDCGACDSEHISHSRDLLSYYKFHVNSIENLINHHEEIERKLKESDRKLKESETSRKALADRLANTENDLSQTKKKLAESDSNLAKESKKLKETEDRLKAHQDELKKTTKELVSTKNELAKANEKYQKLEVEAKAKDEKLKTLEAELRSKKTELADTKNRLEAYKKDLEKTTRELVSSKNALEKANAKCTELDGKLKTKEDELKKKQIQLEKTGKDLCELQKDYENLKTSSANDYENINKQLEEAIAAKHKRDTEADQARKTSTKEMKDMKEKYDAEKELLDEKVGQFERQRDEYKAQLNAKGTAFICDDKSRKRGDFYLDTVVYGGKVITDVKILAKILEHAQGGKEFTITNDFMGGDPWRHETKSFTAVYAVGGKGPFKYINVREHEKAKFVK
ncbi:uncharacterized protein KY384_008619 [Bacidia gigantensis]|uniref:uncharacterized protein n=1 Tax=Bacidia gigantensis TaxID=2732470 RepID=UPI001D044E94|nr:uncharacterized protein KY384_008619 [Bacidia gigantensis]KAG8527189.1 hypothetical protein KY384_008619 [Bacidia gigantensis]